MTCGALAVAACSPADELAATSTPAGVPESLPPRVSDAHEVQPVTTTPEPERGADDRPDASSPEPTAAGTMPASTPVRVRIPSIGVDSDLMGLGLQPDGTLEVPPDGFPAGWYTGSPTPGELGPAIIAGHVDWAGRPGVFFDLRELSTGDHIAITRQDGSTARFRVTRVAQFDKDHFPTQAVYGDLDHAGLRLITCGGPFDRQARSYEDNLVVFAELA